MQQVWPHGTLDGRALTCNINQTTERQLSRRDVPEAEELDKLGGRVQRPWWGCGEKRSGEAWTGVGRPNPRFLQVESLDQEGLGDVGEVDPRGA